MIDHPMLARNRDEDLAYLEGVYAGVMLDGANGIDRLRHLFTLKRCARHCPNAAYNLATELVQGTARPARRRISAMLQSRAIAMVRDRIADPSADGWHPREKSIRRLGSMAMVNLGNIRQYGLKLPEIAHADYLEAARMYHGNEVAHLNVGTMNFGGLVAQPDGELALRHYRRALELGAFCKSLTPNCDCVATIVHALEQVPPGERTAALPRIRAMMERGRRRVEMPSTTGLTMTAAAEIEYAIDEAFSDLDADSPIERRVTRVASLAATLCWLYAGCARDGSDGRSEMDFAAAIVDAIGPAEREPDRMLIPNRREEEVADEDACGAMYGTDELTFLYDAVHRCARTIFAIGERNGSQGPAHVHAVKTALGSASAAWRHGLLSTMPNAFLNPPIGPVLRVAIPAVVGRAPRD